MQITPNKCHAINGNEHKLRNFIFVQYEPYQQPRLQPSLATYHYHRCCSSCSIPTATTAVVSSQRAPAESSIHSLFDSAALWSGSVRRSHPLRPPARCHPAPQGYSLLARALGRHVFLQPSAVGGGRCLYSRPLRCRAAAYFAGWMQSTNALPP